MRYTTQFLLSALAAEQFPPPDAPEIAFLGRSNVGKSSLLNKLVGEKAAKVSQTPGRTRAINFFALVDQSQRRKLVFADLPGYGYAKISRSISAGWPAFIEPYLAILGSSVVSRFVSCLYRIPYTYHNYFYIAHIRIT